MLEKDKYHELLSDTRSSYKKKGSKFIAYAFRVYSDKEIKEKLKKIKKIDLIYTFFDLYNKLILQPLN